MALIPLILRAVQFLWILLITALIGNVIARNINGPMATVNFTMFTAAWSWITWIYGLAACFMASLAIPIIMLPLEGLAVLLTFINAIVLSARLGAPNCSNIRGSGPTDDWIGFGDRNVEHRCREIQASTAFMWFLWACFCASLFFVWRESRGVGRGASVRSSRPNMSQV